MKEKNPDLKNIQCYRCQCYRHFNCHCKTNLKVQQVLIPETKSSEEKTEHNMNTTGETEQDISDQDMEQTEAESTPFAGIYKGTDNEHF
jgi:hypothetical protein